MKEIWDRSLGREDPLEKEMVAHSRTLAGKLMDRGAGRAASMRLQRAGHTWAGAFCLSLWCKEEWMWWEYSVLIEFNNKRNLEVYGYIPLCLFTRMVIKDWERKNPWHPGAGLVSQQGDALLLLDVKALTELQSHTGSHWEQEWRRQQTPFTAPSPTPRPLPWLKSTTAPSLPVTALSSLWSPLSIDGVTETPLVALPRILCSTQSRATPLP